MNATDKLERFNAAQLVIINKAAEMAEELVSNYYKMSANQWLRRKYDFKTLVDLNPDEIVSGPFAQVIRYEGQPKNSQLGSNTYDFYKICLQDHAILGALRHSPDLRLMPFSLYILTHELIHIVRFSKFLCNFVASAEEKATEEARVHRRTHAILKEVSVPGLPEVFNFYIKWHEPIDQMETP